MFESIESLAAAPISNDVRRFIAHCDNLELLQGALEAEWAREGGGRKTRIDQLRMRIDVLKAQKALAPAAPAVEPEVVAEAPVVEAAPVVDEPAAEVVVEEPVAPVAPVVEEVVVSSPAYGGEAVAEVVATAERSPELALAVVFMRALRSGSEPLVTECIRQIRIDGAKDGELAAALVEAFRAEAPAKPARPARAERPAEPKAPRVTTAEKLLAAINGAARDEHGVVTLTKADLERAGAPDSWKNFSGAWYSTLVEPVKGLGFTAKVKRVSGEQQIVLSPVGTDEQPAQ
jgi:hypothetical protein